MEFFKAHKTVVPKLICSETDAPQLPMPLGENVEAESVQSHPYQHAETLAKLSRQVDHHVRRGELGRADQISRQMLTLAQGQDHSASVPALPTEFRARRQVLSVQACILGALFTSMALLYSAHTAVSTNLYQWFMDRGMVNPAIATARTEYAIQVMTASRFSNYALDAIADALVCDGRFSEATQLTKQVRFSENKIGLAWSDYLTGLIHLEEENYSIAELCFKQDIARNFFTTRDGLTMLLCCYMGEGRQNEASATVDAIGPVKPSDMRTGDSRLCEALGDYAATKGNLPEQRMWYLRSIELNNLRFKMNQFQYVRVAHKYAWQLYRLGYYKLAGEWEQRAVDVYARYSLVKTEFPFPDI